jgi:uncharacterized protein YecE (DUF72 family)
MSRIRIGVSGWTYEPWRGSFYPEGMRPKDELAYASRRLHSIEINGTFYSLLRPANYRQWYEQTPAGFRFSLKGPKYLTHVRRLKDFETPLANFLASGILALRDKLGPILWQLPPSLAFDAERVEAFLAALPHDTQRAVEIGRGHSDWLAGRELLETDAKRPLLHAIEARHASFKTPAFVEMARRHKVAVVVGDTAGRWPLLEDVTADFVYVRLHGDEALYENGYTKPALERWAQRSVDWSRGLQPDDAALVVDDVPARREREVYVYFDNDTKETAPFDAIAMMTRLSQMGVVELPEELERPAKAVVKEKGKATRRAKATKEPKSAAKERTERGHLQRRAPSKSARGAPSKSAKDVKPAKPRASAMR